MKFSKVSKLKLSFITEFSKEIYSKIKKAIQSSVHNDVGGDASLDIN